MLKVSLSFSMTSLSGYYCPNGTITNDQFPCPPGTYTGFTNLTAAEECDACWEGYYCTWGTGKWFHGNKELYTVMLINDSPAIITPHHFFLSNT